MSDEKVLINTARDAIGIGNSETDWKIVPTEHASMFADKAPSLAENLRGARVLGSAGVYEEQNGRAVTARDDFKGTVDRANKAIFIAASFGALLLIAASLQEFLGDAGPLIFAVIGACGVISGGLAAMWLNQVKGGDFASNWVRERAKAEAKRLAYFKAVMEGASEEPLDQLLALEYTRRFLLDNQLDYFRERGEEHEKEARNALNRSTLAIFLASTLTAIAGLLAMLQPQLAIIAGLGAIASAYGALVESRSAVNRDSVRKDLYRASKEQLSDRKLEIDVYRKKTALAEEGAVQAFFDPIFVILEADHKAFLDDSDILDSAIGGMEMRHNAAKELINKEVVS